MRLKVTFEGVDLKPSNKVILPVPEAIVKLSDLVVYLRETFGLPTHVISQVSLEMDGFHLQPDSFLCDVLSNDDLVTATCTACSSNAGKQYNPTTVHEARQPLVPTNFPLIPFSIGDTIQFIEEPSSSDRMNSTVETVAVVEGIDTALWGETNPVIIFKDAQGSWDTLRLVKMTQLTILKKAEFHEKVCTTDSIDHIDNSSGNLIDTEECLEEKLKITSFTKREIPVIPNIIDPNGISWRKRQRTKSLGALRRQIEWFVKSEDRIDINELCLRRRISDITDDAADVEQAISNSHILVRDGYWVIRAHNLAEKNSILESSLNLTNDVTMTPIDDNSVASI